MGTWTDRSFSQLLKGMPQEKLLFLEAGTLKGSVVLHEEAEDVFGCAVPGFCCPGCCVLELHSSFFFLIFKEQLEATGDY